MTTEKPRGYEFIGKQQNSRTGQSTRYTEMVLKENGELCFKCEKGHWHVWRQIRDEERATVLQCLRTWEEHDRYFAELQIAS